MANESPVLEAVSSEPVSVSTRHFFLWRWLVWVSFVLPWTQALLTPSPERYVSYEPLLDYSFHFSKSLHVVAYALFAVLSGWLGLSVRGRWLLLAFMIAHAFATEFAQQYVKDRYPSLRDVGLDHVGILLGITCSWSWWRNKRSLAV